MVDSNFVIIADTREQQVYSFQNTPIEYTKLETGDYTLKNYETQITIERKSLDDFVNSVIVDQERFFREVKRMQSFDSKFIVVEGSLPEIRERKYKNNVNPENIIGQIVSLITFYEIPVILCSDRQNAIDIVLRILKAFYEKRTNTGTNRVAKGPDGHSKDRGKERNKKTGKSSKLGNKKSITEIRRGYEDYL